MRMWYYVVDNEKKGPVSEEELIALLKSGELSSDTLVWTEGMEEWARIDATEILKSLPLAEAPQERESPAVDAVVPEVIDSDERKKKCSVPQVRPWVRYWARGIDYCLFGFVLGIMLLFVAPQALLINNLLFGICIGGAFLFIEAAMLSWWGATPGKWIMQIRVRKNNGGKLTYLNALSRAFNVWMRGVGFGIPLVSLITHLSAYNRLRERDITSWDEAGQLIVSHRRIGFFRALLAIAILVFFYGMLPALGSM